MKSALPFCSSVNFRLLALDTWDLADGLYASKCPNRFREQFLSFASIRSWVQTDILLLNCKQIQHNKEHCPSGSNSINQVLRGEFSNDQHYRVFCLFVCLMQNWVREYTWPQQEPNRESHKPCMLSFKSKINPYFLKDPGFLRQASIEERDLLNICYWRLDHSIT